MNDAKYKLPESPRASEGMTVPEGYFKSFSERMRVVLPVNEAAENPGRLVAANRTMWQRVRPFVYMAAMFAGVWCMTKMFSLMHTQSADSFSIENNSVITAALNNSEFFDDYVCGAMSEYDIMNQLYEEGIELN